MEPTNSSEKPGPKPRYQWPWFVLAAAILAIVLAVLWMTREIQRTKRIRDANLPAEPATNSSVGPN